MLSNTYTKEISVVRGALGAAAELCRNVQDRIAIAKEDRSPVTVADYGSQALVCRAVREAFPDDPIVAEEDSTLLRAPEQSSLREMLAEHLVNVRPGCSLTDAMKWIDYGNAEGFSDRFWTLDPIDGTKGFLRKEHFAVALALIVDGEVAVGGLACPKLGGGTLVAVRGYGAEQGKRSISVSTIDRVSNARFCESLESGHSAHGDAQRVADYLGITTESRRLDSQAKYAVVARGEAEIYMRLPTRKEYVERIWDHAAGALILSEAGGRVTDCTGRKLDFTCGKGLTRNRGIIATNGKLHGEVIRALKALEIGQELPEA